MDCVFELGEFTVSAERGKDTLASVSAHDLERFNRLDVAQGANLLPGVTLSASGQRNESMVHVRGFDLRQVPVFLDGIPVYVPYDGYVDLARFATMDLGRIDVSKGFTSVLHGPNTMGGAINMVTRRPAERLEYNGSLGAITPDGYLGNVNLGSRFGMFYAQAGAAYIQRDDLTLSGDLDASKHEDGGTRENSGFTDYRVNAKVGFTPRARSEHALGLIYQHGEKGVPLYAGDDPQNSLLNKPRYWRWPSWDKQCVYLISRSGIGARSDLNMRAYVDLFRNSLESYDDATYTTQDKPYAFTSKYNDLAAGIQADLSRRVNDRNLLKLAGTLRQDLHEEHNVGSPVQSFADVTWSLGVEDNIYLGRFKVIPGISYNARSNQRADDIDQETGEITGFAGAGASEAINAQVLARFTPIDGHRIGLSASRKTRFATIKDRYSYRMGTALPNPGLRPETAYNMEASYQASITTKLVLDASVFLSELTDVIQMVNNVDGELSQMRNAGRARFFGAELAADHAIGERGRIGANLTWIRRENLDDPEVLFTDVPEFKLFGFIDYRVMKWLFVNINSEHNSERISRSYGVGTDPFTLLNAKLGFQVHEAIVVEGSVNNLLDTNYALVEGYPMEGRNFMVRLLFWSIRRSSSEQPTPKP